jgi:hypothetical protein
VEGEGEGFCEGFDWDFLFALALRHTGWELVKFFLFSF